MNSITPELIDYLTKLPTRPAVSRRRMLEETRRRVACGESGAQALVPFAIADDDDEVVFAATSAYVGVLRDAAERSAAAHDATEWIRRSLAINRGAVFAALLVLGDDGINQRLLPLRLALPVADVATVCRRAARRSCERSRAFLHEWHELLFGQATALEREQLAALLGIGRAQVA